MKAIVIDKFGGPDALNIRDVPNPEPKPGFTVVKVKAFGLNQAEMHMREGHWDEFNPISGLECVGIVEDSPGHLPKGTKVIGLMGGMGRSIPGSYAEFCNVPNGNVIPIETKLSWEDFAAIPETFSCAWSCMIGQLQVQPGEKVLIRGATSALGQAAVKLGVDAGAVVTATTRQKDRFPMLKALGAKEVLLEESDFVKNVVKPEDKFDKVLNLIGNKVLIETLTIIKRGGWLVQAGWLGGLEPIKDFNPMLDMASGVHFILYHSGKTLGVTEEWPVSEVPWQKIVKDIEDGKYSGKPAEIFDFNQIRDAHVALDSKSAGGKIVVRGFPGE